MRDRQQVNIGRSASHTHTLQQKAGVMRLRFFMSRRPSVRLDPSSNAPSQAGGIGWGHWKGPAMLGLEL